MSRLFVFPLLVVSIFLSGCKTGQQGNVGPNAPLTDRIQDAWCDGYQSCAQWVENHPAARTTAYVTGFVLIVAAVVAGVAAYLYFQSCDDH